MVGNSKATVFPNVCDNVKLYQPALWALKGTKSYRPNPTFTNNLTEEGEQIPAAHAKESLSGDHKDRPRCP